MVTTICAGQGGGVLDAPAVLFFTEGEGHVLHEEKVLHGEKLGSPPLLSTILRTEESENYWLPQSTKSH